MVWVAISHQLWLVCSSPGGPASAVLNKPQEVLVGVADGVPGPVQALEAASLICCEAG